VTLGQPRQADLDHLGVVGRALAVAQHGVRVGVGPLAVVLDHGVDPVGAGSSAWADVHAPRLLVRAYAPLARLALRRLVAA
jgi:hypothetical protein